MGDAAFVVGFIIADALMGSLCAWVFGKCTCKTQKSGHPLRGMPHKGKRPSVTRGMPQKGEHAISGRGEGRGHCCARCVHAGKQ